MEQSKKHIITSILIVALLMLTGAGFYSFYKNRSIVANPDNTLENKKITPEIIAEQEKKVKPDTASKNKVFQTNEDIRVEYGKLEVVYLYNGRKYEGAVISTGEFYTMVTINGTVKIPMKEVKIREIIR